MNGHAHREIRSMWMFVRPFRAGFASAFRFIAFFHPVLRKSNPQNAPLSEREVLERNLSQIDGKKNARVSFFSLSLFVCRIKTLTINLFLMITSNAGQADQRCLHRVEVCQDRRNH